MGTSKNVNNPGVAGYGGPILIAGAPSSGVNEVQSLATTGAPTGGTIKYTFEGFTTAALAYNASANAIQTAFENLPNLDPGDVACTGGALGAAPVVVTFGGNRAAKNVGAITADGSGLTGGVTPTATATTTTAGVDPTSRGAGPGALAIDLTNGQIYVNRGTALQPNWQLVLTLDQGVRVAKVPLAAVDTAGGIFSWQNPEAGAVLVNRVLVDLTTVASAACTLDIGSTAASGTTLSDNIIDGLDVRTAIGTFSTADGADANGKWQQKVAAGKWITGSKASGASAGLVGFAYIFYIPA